MEVTVFIDKKIEPDQIVKKVMAEKNAFKEAITNGTVRAFAKKYPGKRKSVSANG